MLKFSELSLLKRQIYFSSHPGPYFGVRLLQFHTLSDRLPAIYAFGNFLISSLQALSITIVIPATDWYNG